MEMSPTCRKREEFNAFFHPRGPFPASWPKRTIFDINQNRNRPFWESLPIERFAMKPVCLYVYMSVRACTCKPVRMSLYVRICTHRAVHASLNVWVCTYVHDQGNHIREARLSYVAGSALYPGIPISCIPLSLSPCIPSFLSVSLYPCMPVSLYPGIPVSRYPGILYPCIPVSLHPCIPASLYPCIPAFLHYCIPVSLYPYIPVALYVSGPQRRILIDCSGGNGSYT